MLEVRSCVSRKESDCRQKEVADKSRQKYKNNKIMSHYSQTRVSHKTDKGEESPRKRFRVLGAFSMASLFLMMIGYLCMVNRNAVAGYSMRVAEKRMTELSTEAQKLRIREAELRSLYGLENASSQLDMHPVEDAVSIDAPGPIAYGR